MKRISRIEEVLGTFHGQPLHHLENEKALRYLLRDFILLGRVKCEVSEDGIYTHRLLINKMLRRDTNYADTESGRNYIMRNARIVEVRR